MRVAREAELRVYAAELLGTFLLVFAGPGAAVIAAATGTDLGSLGVGLCFGLAVMVAVATVGHLSGAHINPAVTLAFAVTRHFPWRSVPGYVAAQLTGAALAAGTLRLMFGHHVRAAATLPSGSATQAVALEGCLTFFLMLVIVSVATDVRAKGTGAALAIGGYVGLAATFAGPVAGASMNPARSLGPALASGTWADQWVYVAGPLAGALLGAIAYAFIGHAQPPRPQTAIAATSRAPRLRVRRAPPIAK